MKKYLPCFYILLVIIFIALITAFFWEEKLDYKKVIDSDKLADFFTIIGSFATSITVYLLYKQVEEMVNGRNAAYQPELFFHDKTVYTKNIPNSNFLPQKGVSRPTHIVGFNDDQNAPEFYSNIVIELHNIGLDTAKKVNFQWQYDEQEVIKYIGNKYDSAQIYRKETTIDFVQINSRAELYLPYAFMQLYGVKFALQFPDTEQSKKPQLQISLSYQNIFGKDYKNTFEVKFTQEKNKVFIRFE